MEINRDLKTIKMARVFDAPVELMWRIYTDASLMPKWWGQKNNVTTVDKMDFKVGGIWRIVQKDPNGEEYAFNGKFLEIVPNQKIKQTFEFEPMAGHILTESIEFIEENGKTKLVSTSHFETLEDLDGMVESGMEEGAVESWDQLEELVGTIK